MHEDTTYTLMKNCKGTKRLDLYLEKYKESCSISRCMLI